MNLVKRANKFIEEKWDRKSPLLLGYSGGPDSKALLYSLLEKGDYPIHLAHVDHGWREESRDEALALREEAGKLGLPFHSIRLSDRPVKNMEAHGREERLAYFGTLFEKIPFQALLLAHHADDCAETSLKRIFEGAHLPFLGGIAPVSDLEGMVVWRPLLQVKKEEIWDYLNRKKLVPLLDRTNEDPKFLRTRLRCEILPYLNQKFGKEVSGNLSILGERAVELREYLDSKIADAWERRRERSWGIAVCFDGLCRIEARHLLQKQVRFSRELLEDAVDSLLRREENISFRMGGQTLIADRGWAFFLTGAFSGDINNYRLVVCDNFKDTCRTI